MPALGRQGVINCLVQFFKSRSGNPSVITGAASNVKVLCGYAKNPGGWRALSETISYLPPIASAGYSLKGTDMDRLATIGDIATKLMAPPLRDANFKAKLRTGDARFLALDHERS